MGLSATQGTGHFYFAQTGHSHFAATEPSSPLTFPLHAAEYVVCNRPAVQLR
jgi:hypothetical protein